ncbi:MAG: hypothetical protein AAGJ40_02065 [Planctomycetota bacterium]
MSVRKLTTSLLTALAFFAGGQLVSAQNNNYLTPGDPFSMERDMNWFEPIYDADILDMKPKKRANTGWFATIDRLMLYGTRPELENAPASNSKFDEGQGTRYEVGWMLPDEDHGFLFTFTEFDIDARDTFRTLRVNSLNEEGLPDGDAEFPTNPFGLDALIDTRGNNFGFNTRFVDVGPTDNVADFTSYEAMKTWRLEPYHYGGILEPMFGFRYSKLDDLNGETRYSRSFDPIVGVNVTDYLLPDFATGLPNVVDAIEFVDSLVHRTSNDMISMQAGFRYFKYQGKVRYSTEFRGFTGINFQCSEVSQAREVVAYDGFDASDEVDLYVFSQGETLEAENEEFFIGFDIRAELGYQLTRMIQVRGGMQLINLATGIWRGGPMDDRGPGGGVGGIGLIDGGSSDQNFLALGGTFGLEINR